MEEKTRRKRRIFTEEFKQEAVELIEKIGISKAEKELVSGAQYCELGEKNTKSQKPSPLQEKNLIQILRKRTVDWPKKMAT